MHGIVEHDRNVRAAGPFADRSEAGRLLAKRLLHYRGRRDVIVLAVPRGGAPVALQVARALGVPLDALLVQKLGYPGRAELVIGAIASGGVRVLDHDLARSVDASTFALLETRERRELERREGLYRPGRPPLKLWQKVVILVDDGAVTGETMLAAIHAARALLPTHVVVAVPVASIAALRELDKDADEVVCLWRPEPFVALHAWYKKSAAVSEAEVRRLLAQGSRLPEPTLHH